MKWQIRICTVLWILGWSVSSVGQGQIPTPNIPVIPSTGEMPVPINSSPLPAIAPNNNTNNQPQVQQPQPQSTPTPSHNESLSWAASGLKEELQRSLERLAEVKPKKKNSKKAQLSTETLANYRRKISEDPKDQKIRLKVAEHFDAIDDSDNVIEVLRPILSSLPRKGLIMLARAYRDQKDHINEVSTLETLISQKEKDYVAHYMLAEAYASLGRNKDALTKYEEAKRMNPRYLPPYEALLREAKRGGFFHDSIQVVQDMIENLGEKPRFYNELCLLYAYEAFFEKGIETCKIAIRKDPKQPANHVFLGLLIRDKDGAKAAEKVLKQAAQQFPNSELAQWAAGEASWERKNYPAAHQFFQGAVKSKADSARAQIGLARSAFELQKYDEALPAFVHSCKLNRGLLPEFRRAAATLRQRDDRRWSSKYDAGLQKCGL